MKLGPTLRSIALFLVVAAATFVATDPAALTDWQKALIGAGIAGFAAIGITPPFAAAPTANAVYRQFDQVQTQLQNLHGHIGGVAEDLSELDGDHETTAQLVERLLARVEALEGPHPTIPPPPLAPVPTPPEEPPAPEVPS